MILIRDGVNNLFEWVFQNVRRTVILVAFSAICLCASLLGFETFSLYGVIIATIVAASMVLYDVQIAPRFSPRFHRFNRALAAVLSVFLMLTIGITGCYIGLKRMDDPVLMSLNEEIKNKREDIKSYEREAREINASVSGPGFAMNGDKGMLKDAKKDVRTANEKASKAREELSSLLARKTKYSKDNGNDVKAVFASVAKVFGVGENTVTLIVFVFIWFSVMSIQTAASDEVHNRDIKGRKINKDSTNKDDKKEGQTNEKKPSLSVI